MYKIPGDNVVTLWAWNMRFKQTDGQKSGICKNDVSKVWSLTLLVLLILK